MGAAAVELGPDAGWPAGEALLQPGGNAFFLCVLRLAVVEGVLAADGFGGVAAEDGACDGADEFWAGGVAVS